MGSWRTILGESVLRLSEATIGRSGPLISGVSLELGAGDVFVLLGQNGSGKSTLLQTICGIIPPLSGSVTVSGTEVSGMKPGERCRRIAWVPQEEFVDFGWTAREFAALGRASLSDSVFESKDDIEKTLAALEKCDAEAFADRPMNELSGGERQRVRIARALAQDADILVLDEPASQLDIAHVLGILALIESLAESGKTILLTVHDVNQAFRLRSKMGFVNAKRLEIFESLGEVFASGVLKRTYNTDFRLLEGELLVPVTSGRTTG